MPNINLLDGKDFSREVEKIDEETVSYQDFQVEEPEIETVVEPVEQPVVEQPEPKEEPAAIEEPRPFRSHSSNWPMIVGIAASFVIIILILYFLLGRESGEIAQGPESGTADSTNSAMLNEPVDSTQTVSQQAGEVAEPQTRQEPQPTQPAPIETTVSAGLAEVRKTGAAGASLLGEFFSAFPAGMKMSFFSYGNSRYAAEVVASSDAVFRQFDNNLKTGNASLSPEVVSEKEVMVGSQVMKMRQLSGSFSPAGGAQTASKHLASNRIRRDIADVAAKFNLVVNQLSLSPAVSSAQGQFRPATIKASGDQANIIEFIRSLLDYRNVGINRLMVSVLSRADLSESKRVATLDLDIYP